MIFLRVLLVQNTTLHSDRSIRIPGAALIRSKCGSDSDSRPPKDMPPEKKKPLLAYYTRRTPTLGSQPKNWVGVPVADADKEIVIRNAQGVGRRRRRRRRRRLFDD